MRVRTVLRSKIRLACWRWHRRMGLLSAVFVVLLSVTGILLNHSAALNLDEAKLSPRWLAAFYRVDPPPVVSFSLGERWLSQVGRGIYRNDSLLFSCQGQLVGALNYHQFEVLACERELAILLADSGEMVERLGPSLGLPTPVQALGLCGSTLCLRSDEDVYRVDLDALRWPPLPDAQSATWSTAKPAPEALQRQLTATQLGSSISWERFLLDLHSGRIVGGWGVWLMDLMALLFLVLAFSGIAIWLLNRIRAKRPNPNSAPEVIRQHDST